MRKPFIEKYDAIFNLFTSFGYFENDIDDILVLKNIKNGLKQNGFIVLDFLNVVHVKNNLVTEEIKTVAGIKFNLQREITDGFILKHISFTEKVKYLDLEKFETYFSAAGLKINHIFGNYQLSKFNSETSDRLIFVAS
jgi:SAM-dependent methyltransferase